LRRRVLHIIYSLFRGGAERLIETQLLTSDQERYELLICAVTGGDDLVGALERAGATVFLLNKRHRGDLTVIWKIINLIRRENIDLLHLHNAPGTFWGTLAAALGGVRIPIVRTEHRPYLPQYLPWVYRALYRYMSRRAEKIICVSQSVKTSYLENFTGVSRRYVTIMNGIRTRAFTDRAPRAECRAQFKLPSEAHLIGTVGRLTPIKNQRLLIEATAIVRSKIADTHLAILGSGELMESLIAVAADLGLSDAVSFVSPTAEVEHFLGALDVFALSSDSEGLPLTILEALAAGLPVAATDVGGISEVIEDRINGYIVPKGSASTLAQAITLLMKSPEEAAIMGKRGREKVQRLFSADRMVREIEAVYNEVLSGRDKRKMRSGSR
jgi:glycosyltransferase involved in cell wall biosynthesis